MKFIVVFCIALLLFVAALIIDWQREHSSAKGAFLAYWPKYLLIFVIVLLFGLGFLHFSFGPYLLLVAIGVMVYFFYDLIWAFIKGIFTKKPIVK